MASNKWLFELVLLFNSGTSSINTCMGTCISCNASASSPPVSQPNTKAGAGFGKSDYLFKFLVVGDSGVGKSCLVSRFADNAFSESFVATVGMDFKLRSLAIDRTRIKLLLWDASGDQKYRAIISSFYQQPHAVLVVFDLANRATFENLQVWLQYVKCHSNEEVVSVLIGNKTDLVGQRQVSTEEAQLLADKLGFRYFETSAKDSSNVNNTFTQIAQLVQIQIEA